MDASTFTDRELRAAISGLHDRLRAYLDGHLTGDVTLAGAARLLDRSVPHLVRSFTKRYHISPHAYVVGARVDMARKLLLQGETAARVAVQVGFHDQAHLTRHFKRHVSVAPAGYAAGVRGVPRRPLPPAAPRRTGG